MMKQPWPLTERWWWGSFLWLRLQAAVTGSIASRGPGGGGQGAAEVGATAAWYVWKRMEMRIVKGPKNRR